MNPLDPTFQQNNYNKNPEGFSPSQIAGMNSAMPAPSAPEADLSNFKTLSSDSVPSPKLSDTLPPISTSQPTSLPEWNTPKASVAGGDQKKQLLQKMLSNLLNKPGRSMHEMIAGVKEIIGAYKNFAKEWDTLNSAVSGNASDAVNGAVKAGQSAGSGIQKIMKGIQDKKSLDGGGGPGMPSSMSPSPIMVAPRTANFQTSAPAPIQQMPPLPPTNVPSNGYKQPAPVSSLGIYGF